MTSKHRYLGTLGLLVAASCGANEDQTAGGQSGTDANGGMECDYHFAEPRGDVTPLTEPLDGGLTPNDYYDRIEGSYDFSCADGIHVSVSILRGGEARTTLALSGSPRVPVDYCPLALQLDATVHAEASDGSFSHDASFLTAHLGSANAYTRYDLGGEPQSSSDEALELRLETDYDGPHAGLITRLYVAWSLSKSEHCELAMETGEGGSGNEPEPNDSAGAAGAP